MAGIRFFLFGLLGLAMGTALLGAGCANSRSRGENTAVSRASFLAPGGAGCAGIVDLVLIYQGGTHRPDWTREEFRPYLAWRNPESGCEEWLFDGFLFLEFKDGRGREYAKGYKQAPARREDWEWLLGRLFEPGKALCALDAETSATEARIGPPPRRRKVVVSIHEPIAGQRDWGELDGRALDFRRVDDRVAACQWYLGEIERRWKAAHFTHIDLAGVYWIAEHSNECEKVLAAVSLDVHRRGWKFFWIPYWKARGAAHWRELGFDAAYQQPNHFFHPEIADSRLDAAVDFARRHEMGLEMEWDGRALSRPETFAPRMAAYLDAFVRGGAVGGAAMAHYEGGGALLAMSRSEEPVARALYKRYCSMVVRRQHLAPPKQ